MTTIGLISDSSDFLNKLEKNISLMRKNDVFFRYDFSKFNGINSNVEIILIYAEHSNITENFINRVKNDNNYLILFLPDDKLNLLLKLYDYGINDFCSPEAPIYELIVKIVNGQKYLSAKNLNSIYKNVLAANSIVNENNSIYRKFETVLTPRLMKTCLKSSFLAIDIPLESREMFIASNLETRMASLLRSNDIIVNYSDFSYLLILVDTEFDRVRDVFEKISNSLKIKLTGMLLRYKSPKEEDILNRIENLRVIADKEDSEFVIEPESGADESEKDWLNSDIESEEHKNYKFFRVMYEAKVEKVIKPVFFRMQEKYEDILSDTRIKFLHEKESSEFILFKGDKTNSLKISFNNSPNLSFSIRFSGIYTPENSEFSEPCTQLTISKLTEIIQKFVEAGVKNEIN